MLAVGDIDEARNTCRTLEEISATFDTEVLRALAAAGARRAGSRRTRCSGRARCAPSRFRSWQRVEAPYEAARVRVLMTLVCRAPRVPTTGHFVWSTSRM
jgi:hypothetical protein